MWGLALGFTALLASATDSTAACSRMIVRGIRPVGSTALSLRATRDSVQDDHLPPASPEPGRRYTVDRRRERVYGQVFSVTAVAGPDAHYWDGQRLAVLVWWQLGGACTHHPPRSALHPHLNELFIAARPSLPPRNLPTEFALHRMFAAELRPPEYWVGGVPTIDVQWDVDRYSPEFPQVRGAPDAGLPSMTIAEYAALYPFLPEESAIGIDDTATRRLLAASIANRRWWDQYPRHEPTVLGLDACRRWSREP